MSTQTQVRPAAIAVAPFTYTVSPQPGHYLVTETGRAEVRVYRVGKDKSCNCGTNGDGNGHGPYCRHVGVVRRYLEAGGSRAPETSQATEEPQPKLQACPLCGAPVRRRMPYRNRYTGQLQELWTCPGDAAHYWQWRRAAAQARMEHPTNDVQARREERRQWLVEMYRLSGASDERIAAFLDEPWSDRRAFQKEAKARLIALAA